MCKHSYRKPNFALIQKLSTFLLNFEIFLALIVDKLKSEASGIVGRENDGKICFLHHS